MRASIALCSLCTCALLVASSAGCRSGRESARHPDRQETLDANDVGTVLVVADATERAVLARLAELREGRIEAVGQWRVVAEPPYAAASGRKCRRVSLSTAAVREARLACSEGEEWFFVPDVFGGDDAAPALESE